MEQANAELRAQLGKILEETTAGDPMSALRTNKSRQAIAEELSRQGHLCFAKNASDEISGQLSTLPVGA